MAVEFATAALDRAAVSPGRKPGYVDAPRVTVVAGTDRNLRSEHLLPRRIVEPDGKIALGVRNAYVEYITAWVGEKLHRNARTVDDHLEFRSRRGAVEVSCRYGQRRAARSAGPYEQFRILYAALHDLFRGRRNKVGEPIARSIGIGKIKLKIDAPARFVVTLQKEVRNGSGCLGRGIFSGPNGDDGRAGRNARRTSADDCQAIDLPRLQPLDPTSEGLTETRIGSKSVSDGRSGNVVDRSGRKCPGVDVNVE